MNKNVGTIDKVIRLIMAIILFSMFFILEGNWRFIAIVGLIPLITAIASTCPLYSLVGLNTCPLKKA